MPNEETIDIEQDLEGVELVPAAESMQLAVATPASASPLARLAAMENALEVIERQEAIVTTIRKSALRLTSPADWVRMKGKHEPDEQAFCLLKSSGARKIGPQFYAIALTEVGPVDGQGVLRPIEEKGEDGEVRFTLFGTAHVGLTGETIRGLKGSRSSSEQFIGRGGLETTSPLVARGDLAEACNSLLYTKAVRVGAGMKSVPVRELVDAWKGTDKKVEYITKGSGFGSATDRAASAVASDDVKTARTKLGNEILSRTGGDKEAARKVLKEITSNLPKFGGFDSIERLAQDWQVANAMAKLKTHDIFGDQKNGASK